MEKPKEMSAAEYKALKTRLGASYSAIASSVGVSQRTAIRWASGGLRGASVTVLKAMERAARGKTPAALALALLLAGCASGVECAPNGTCWPVDYTPTKDARVMIADNPAEVCGAALHNAGWGGYLEGKTVLACTVGPSLPEPIVILPRRLPEWAARDGWSLAMLERYEKANANGKAVYHE